MTNEELTELCTRVATKALGWKQSDAGIEWIDQEGYPHFPVNGGKDDNGVFQLLHPTLELISPWGRDLVEKATFPKGSIVEIHYFNSKHLGGWVCEIGIGAGRSGSRTFYRSEIAVDNLNLACLLAADKAVSNVRN